jgi:hypothetical protein
MLRKLRRNAKHFRCSASIRRARSGGSSTEDRHSPPSIRFFTRETGAANCANEGKGCRCLFWQNNVPGRNVAPISMVFVSGNPHLCSRMTVLRVIECPVCGRSGRSLRVRYHPITSISVYFLGDGARPLVSAPMGPVPQRRLSARRSTAESLRLFRCAGARMFGERVREFAGDGSAKRGRGSGLIFYRFVSPIGCALFRGRN